MSVHIGSVTLDFPLVRENIAPPVVMGSNTVTCGGHVVSLEYENPNQESCPEEWFFEWESQATVAALKALWLAGGEYTADLEGKGASLTVRFSRDKGVTDIKHSYFSHKITFGQLPGFQQDRCSGKLNLFVDRS